MSELTKYDSTKYESTKYDSDFPWRNYTVEQLNEDFSKLRDKINKTKEIAGSSRHGFKCSDYFFQKQRLNTNSDTNVSCVEYWKNNKKKLLEYSSNTNYGKDLFGTLVFMKKAPSNFSPYIAGMIYKHFNANSVLDPYAGWGNRCLAALALDIDYLGIDSNEELCSSYENMIDFFPHTSDIRFINDKCENVKIDKEIDLIFSSPPFWNKGKKKLLEVYPNCETDYETFLKSSLFYIMKQYINTVPIALYIPEDMYLDIEKIFGKASYTITYNDSSNKTKVRNRNHVVYCWVPEE